jgi:hypothetical protein
MNFLPVTNDVHILELVYALYPDLSEQQVNFSECADISLGLIETNGLEAVLSVGPKFFNHDDTLVTLQRIKVNALDGKAFICLEPLQRLNLRFSRGRSVLEATPLTLPENTPFYSLIQLLVLGRLEYVLAEMDVFHLDINQKAVTAKLSKLLRLRGYEEARGVCSKYLLMTNTANVLP